LGRDIQIYKRNEKLNILYKQCIEELKNIGIDVYNIPYIGNIDISISKRNTKRYGCCKQEEPNPDSKTIEKIGRKRIVRYAIFNRHHIEISPWVMDLDDGIIKNTIIHELIHCIPHCNNHGQVFKKYAKYINERLEYNISRLGNKKEDYIKSNVEYSEKEEYKYYIKCINCGQEYLRKRINKYFTRRYRCGKCKGKLEIINSR